MDGSGTWLKEAGNSVGQDCGTPLILQEVPGCEQLSGGWPVPPRCHAGTNAYESRASAGPRAIFEMKLCAPHLSCTYVHRY